MENLLDLPNEILRNHILSYIPKEELLCNVGFVCKRFMHILFDLYRNIIISNQQEEKIMKIQRKVQERLEPNPKNRSGVDGTLVATTEMIRNFGGDLERKLMRILLTREIARHVTSFQMYNTIWQKTRTNKMTVAYDGDSVPR